LPGARFQRPGEGEVGLASALGANERQRPARPATPGGEELGGVAIGLGDDERRRRALAHAELEQAGLAHRLGRHLPATRRTGPWGVSCSWTPRRASSAASWLRSPVKEKETSAPWRPTASMRICEISVEAAPSR